MSVARMTIKGNGQLELNNVAFSRDGRIEAQCAPNATDFATKKVENGMILAVDNVAREVKLPTLAANELLALVYSAEVAYDERHDGLKDYFYGVDGAEFLPRLGYLSRGDKFTTNTVSYDSATYSDWAALASAVAAGSIYGGASVDGSIVLGTSAPTAGPVLKAVKAYTMPDGQNGIKFQVL